jgi:hypothetical protein
MTEKWRVVDDFPSYWVSDQGQVYNWVTSHVLTRSSKNNGHLSVELMVDKGKTVTKTVGRLVAEAFLGSSDGRVVGHINGDVTDNRLENLVYRTRSEVQRLIPGVLKSVKKVRVVETGEVFPSVADCARAIGAHPSNVSNVLRGIYRTSKGHTFEYVD